jgi:hypothetical protein
MKESLNLKFRFVKIADIAYIIFISYFMILILAMILNNILGEFNAQEEEKKIQTNKNHLKFLFFKGLILLIISAILMYIFRNLFKLIPSPLDGLYGFEHKRVKEIESIPVIFFFLVFIYQRDLFLFLAKQKYYDIL